MKTLTQHDELLVKPYIDSKIQSLTNQVKDMTNELGAKNVLTITRDDLLEFNTDGTWTGDSYAYRGVTFACTFNDAGCLTKVTASGTTSSNVSTIQLIGNSSNYQKNVFKGMFIKGCPSGGSSSTYRVSIGTATDATGSEATNEYERGSGLEINNKDYLRLFIRVEPNYAITGSLEFNLMITPKAVYDIDSTWKNPSKTNQALTADVASLQDNEEVNGAVNMLQNIASDSVSNGITCTVGPDGTMTLTSDGTTRTGNTDFIVKAAFALVDGMTYKLSGCPSGGSTTDSGYRLALRNYDTDTGEGVVITANSSTGLAKDVLIRVGKDYVFDGSLVFKPMITVPTYNGDYVPYAKSNKELTDDVAIIPQKYTKYDIPGGIKNITITTAAQNNRIEFFSNFGQMDFDVSTNWRSLGKCIVNRNNPPSNTITYSISGKTLTINSVETLTGFILARVDDLVITTSSTSTPQANTMESVNLYDQVDEGVSAHGGTLAVAHTGVTANVATQIISKRGVYLALFTFYDVASAAYLINVDSSDSSKCFATELAAPPSGVTITFDFSTAGKVKVTADHGYRARVITIADANY